VIEELSSNAFHQAAGTYDFGNPNVHAEPRAQLRPRLQAAVLMNRRHAPRVPLSLHDSDHSGLDVHPAPAAQRE
jgi:hypothetical protein